MSCYFVGASQKVSGSAFEALGVPQNVSDSAFEVLGVPQKVLGFAFEALGASQKVSGSACEVLGTSQKVFRFPTPAEDGGYSLWNNNITTVVAWIIISNFSLFSTSVKIVANTVNFSIRRTHR